MKLGTLFKTSVFVFYLGMSSLYAQDYAASIESAVKLYESGKAAECIEILKPFAGNDAVPVNYRWQAYRLNALSFQLLGDDASARKNALNFLRLNPTYSPNFITDTREFRTLIQSMVVIPKFSLGIAGTAGTNITIPRVIQSYSVSGSQKTYHSLGSYQFGIQVGYTLSESLSASIGLLNTGRSFRTEYDVDNWKFSVSEKMQFLDVPLQFRYSFMKNNRLRPYLHAGGFWSYMVSAYNNLHKETGIVAENQSTERLSALSRRNRNQWGLLGGAGAYYKVKNGHLNVEFGLYHGVTNIADPGARYRYLDIIQRYEYLDDDLRLSNLLLSVGYTYYINYRVNNRNK